MSDLDGGMRLKKARDENFSIIVTLLHPPFLQKVAFLELEDGRKMAVSEADRQRIAELIQSAPGRGVAMGQGPERGKVRVTLR